LFDEVSMISRRSIQAGTTLAALLIVFLAAGAARAQSLRVMPVNIQMLPGQNATTITVINEGSAATAIQVRIYGWNQADGTDQLTDTAELLASPPLATIAAGESQVVRLVLRRAPKGREATYRILLDQIPAATAPGIVQVVIRMSIPVFAQPAMRAVPHVQFHIERGAGKAYLVAVNDGLRHEAIRGVVLSAGDGTMLNNDSGASPYVLAGATRRWLIDAQTPLPLTGDFLHMKAHADAGTLDQQVRIVGTP
jgi:fimbrial chaperone protein